MEAVFIKASIKEKPPITMTLRSVITGILIWISIPAMIIWKYWEASDYNYNNWVSGFEYPLHIQWFVLFLSWHIRDIFLSYAIFRLTFKVRAIRVAAIFNLVYSVIDFGLFFWSFNRGKDTLLVHYTITVAVSLVIVFSPKIIQLTKEKHHQRKDHIINYKRV